MRSTAILFAAALVGGCAARPVPVAHVPVPAAEPVAVVDPAATPINAGLSPAATLWHLRTGLNVAALACRGPEAAALTARYNALLVREAERFRTAEAAYAAEYAARGPAGRKQYDDDMTRLYNFWGQARGRAALCAAADAALADPAVVAVPGAQLAALDRAFAPPWIAVDPAVFGGAPVQVASR